MGKQGEIRGGEVAGNWGKRRRVSRPYCYLWGNWVRGLGVLGCCGSGVLGKGREVLEVAKLCAPCLALSSNGGMV